MLIYLGENTHLGTLALISLKVVDKVFLSGIVYRSVLAFHFEEVKNMIFFALNSSLEKQRNKNMRNKICCLLTTWASYTLGL